MVRARNSAHRLKMTKPRRELTRDPDCTIACASQLKACAATLLLLDFAQLREVAGPINRKRTMILAILRSWH